jgi:type I restriction enzyme, R subunit
VARTCRRLLLWPAENLEPLLDPFLFGHEIDLSTVDFDFLTQHKGETTSGKPTGDVPLQPAKESDTGAARDPELVALEDVIRPNQ